MRSSQFTLILKREGRWEGEGENKNRFVRWYYYSLKILTNFKDRLAVIGGKRQISVEQVGDSRTNE